MKILYGLCLMCFFLSSNIFAEVKPLPVDPTKPKVVLHKKLTTETKQVVGASVKLQAITLVGDTRRAVINGKVLAEGDKLSDKIKLLKIHLGKVLISLNGKQKTLRLNRVNVKKESK